MLARICSMLVFITSLFMAIHFTGCECLTPAPASTAGRADLPGSLTPKVNVLGRFATTNLKSLAGFCVHGTYEYSGDPTDKITIDKVLIYGAPGLVSEADLQLTKYLSTLSLPPKRWKINWLPADWDGDLVYSMLVRYDYTIVQNGVPTSGSAIHWGKFLSTVSSTPIPMEVVGGGGPGSTNSHVAVSGTFIGGQGLALYDVQVDYSANVDHIEVWAWPAGQSHVLIHNEPGPLSAPGTYGPVELQGTYDGTSTDYGMQIKVFFTDNTITPNPELTSGRFQAIPSHSGTWLPLN